jgi:hypothetical protein
VGRAHVRVCGCDWGRCMRLCVCVCDCVRGVRMCVCVTWCVACACVCVCVCVCVSDLVCGERLHVALCIGLSGFG